MTTVGVALGILAAAGLLLIITGLQRRDDTPADHPGMTLPGWAQRMLVTLKLTPTEKKRALTATVAAFAFALLTGWVIAIIVVPIAAVGIPRMVDTKGEARKIDRLEAMEEWTRSLSGVLSGAGAGLTDALVSTLRSAPAAIRPEVENLVARLQARRPAHLALRAFADDLGDATGDLIAGALIMGAKETGAALSQILDELATSVADQVRMRREIEAARSGPRSESKILTWIFCGGMTCFVLFTSFGEYYRSPGGQIVLLVVVAAFAACLYWLRVATVAKPTPRFLPATTAPGTDAS